MDLSDIDGALTECAEMIKALVLWDKELESLLDASTGNATESLAALAGHMASYVSKPSFMEFAAKHELSLEHEYETLYVLIAGLIFLLDQHPETPTEAIKTIIDSTLHLKEHVTNAR